MKFINLLVRYAVVMTLVITSTAFAAPFTVTDIAGREVTIQKKPERIILGSGRILYGVDAVTVGNPFQKIIGWTDNLMKYDPDVYALLKEKYPEDTKRIFNIGNPYSNDFSVEKIISEKADLVIIDLTRLFEAKETGLIEKLEKVNIPVVFVDFRKSPTVNTIPSVLLLGKLLGEEKEANAFLDFYMQEMRKVVNVVELLDPKEKPMVFIEDAPGWIEVCCVTYGSYNFGKFVELAGGINYGSTKFNGFDSEVSLEGVIAAKPVHIIATGAQWHKASPEVKAVLLGYNADEKENAKRLKALTERNGFKTLDAVKNGNYHVMYHPWYDSPFGFVLIQKMAKLIHPEEFEKLDPQATLDKLHSRFLSYDAKGQFWVTADKALLTK